VQLTDEQFNLLKYVKEQTLVNFNVQVRALVQQEVERVKKLKDAG
jgi:hypothetical protein